jgi:hypothetical protein
MECAWTDAWNSRGLPLRTGLAVEDRDSVEALGRTASTKASKCRLIFGFRNPRLLERGIRLQCDNGEHASELEAEV